MKKLILTTSLILICFLTNAQSPYYDAIKLTKLNPSFDTDINKYTFKESSTKRLKKILLPYFSDTVILYNATTNPFFKLIGGTQSEGIKEAGTAKSIINSIGGLDVTNYADGIAKFLVNRTKAELNTYFFAGFQEKINESPELKYLFPNTSGLLNVIGDEIYQYNTYINSLRNAFELDLTNIYSNFRKLINTPKYQEAISKVDHLHYFLQSGFYIIDQLNSKVHPADLIHNWDINSEKDTLGKTINSSIKLLDIFSQSLKSVDSSRYWVNPYEIEKLFNDTTFRIYLGLLYIKHKNDELSFDKTKTTFGNVMDSVAKNLKSLNKYKLLTREFINKANEIDLSLKELKNKDIKNKPDPKFIYNFVNNSLDIIELCGEIPGLPYINIDLDKTQFNKFMCIARNGSNIYLNARYEKYGIAISNLTVVMDTIFSVELIKKLVYNKYPCPTDCSKDTLKKNRESERKRLLNVKSNILKYGTFMATIVEAETSEEVASAIESVAMPVGSFRVKRSSQFNMALNGYLGGFAGYEYIPALKSNRKKPNLALSAPVGISLSWTGKKCNEKRSQKHSFGFFVSVIDVGAIASFRFGDDSTAIASTIQLKDIVSPGFSVVWNIRNAPISIMAGAQMGPILRKVYADDVVKEDNIYIRYGLSVVVDIPIINLYNKKD